MLFRSLKTVSALLLATVTALPLEKGPKKVLGSGETITAKELDAIANGTTLHAKFNEPTYTTPACKPWCSPAGSPAYTWEQKCTWDDHCAACAECQPLAKCKSKCAGLAATDGWAATCQWPTGKDCHGCSQCGGPPSAPPSPGNPPPSPGTPPPSPGLPPPGTTIPCDQCTNDYSVCNVCMVAIKANECPVGYQSLQQCTPALTALGQLCEGDGECGTSDAHAQCGDYEVYKHVECVQPPPPPAAPPLSCTACDNNNECGICLTAIPASECPANPNLHQCKADLVSMNGLCEGDGECGTNNNHNQCSGAYEVYRQVDCRPPHAKLTFHTCNVDYADSDKPIYYQADGGSLVELDNTGDDREKNQDDEYSVNWAKNTFSIITSSDDGWCIDKITYGSLSVDLSNQQKSGVWLDKPCSGWDYDRPCTSKITIDVNTGAVQQHHEQGGILPLDLPFLKVHTCNVGNANSDDPIYYSASPAFSQSSHASLDRYGHDDRKKNYFDTYYNLKPASNAFNLAAVDTDGWCVDSIEYVWASQNIKMKADLSCTRDKSLWLDGPCTETDYNGVPCAQNIIVSVIDGDVKMMGVKGQPASMTKDLGSCSACLTKDDCGTAASSMGLTLGGKGYSFDGNYNTKGCYYYPDGTYKGRAYFGTGGTDASMGAAPGNAAQERVACPA